MPIRIAAGDISLYFSEKLSLDISCELSAKQTIHMNVLFSLKKKKKEKKFRMSSGIIFISFRINQ